MHFNLLTFPQNKVATSKLPVRNGAWLCWSLNHAGLVSEGILADTGQNSASKGCQWLAGCLPVCWPSWVFLVWIVPLELILSWEIWALSTILTCSREATMPIQPCCWGQERTVRRSIPLPRGPKHALSQAWFMFYIGTKRLLSKEDEHTQLHSLYLHWWQVKSCGTLCELPPCPTVTDFLRMKAPLKISFKGLRFILSW